MAAWSVHEDGPWVETRSALGRKIGQNDRVMGADSARAVGRFNPSGIDGYRAATLPDAPLRTTRAEATEDERNWLEGSTKL